LESRKLVSKRAGMDSPYCSSPVDCEFLNDRVCQQFGGKFGNPVRYRVRPCGRPWQCIAGVGLDLGGGGLPARNGLVIDICELNLEPFALADRENLGKPETVARTRDGLALRIVDLRLEHDVQHYLGHSTQRTRTWHLTGREERRVLSQRNTMTDDRPLISPRVVLSRQGVARGRQSCRASCLPILPIQNC
jgi:hypothetical protein